MNVTWTSILEYTDELTPHITVSLVFHHWTKCTHVLIWCLRALCWLTGTSLAILVLEE